MVWNNNLEIVAKPSKYEEAAPSQYLHLGYSADEEMRDGAWENLEMLEIWQEYESLGQVFQLKFHLGIMTEIFA